MAGDTRDPQDCADRALTAYARWNERIKASLRPLVNDALIAEHAKNPLGQHSDALERLLNYFAQAPQRGKYVVVCTRPHQEWRIGMLAGARGEPVRLLDDRCFASEEEALHCVFVRRIEDLIRA